MWDLPGPGLKPVSPALAGGFLTTALPGKPHQTFYQGTHQLKKKGDGPQIHKYIQVYINHTHGVLY